MLIAGADCLITCFIYSIHVQLIWYLILAPPYKTGFKLNFVNRSQALSQSTLSAGMRPAERISPTTSQFSDIKQSQIVSIWKYMPK